MVSDSLICVLLTVPPVIGMSTSGCWGREECENESGRCLLTNETRVTTSAARASPVALVVKNPPAKQEVQVQFLSREDPLEEEMAAHSGVLAWKIQWAEKPDRL